MGTYQALFWALFALSLLVFVVNILVTPIIRKKQAQKQTKAQDEAISKVKAGNKVILTSGIHGKVIKIKKKFFQIEIAPSVIIDVDKSGLLGYFKNK